MKYKYNNEWKDLKIKASDTVAIGTIVPFGGNVAPTNWLICDGSAVSRTTYSSLFAVIGTSFGEGDGSTTFNLPDFKDRTPVGVNASGNHFKTIGSKYGEETHTLTKDELPANVIQTTTTGAKNDGYIFRGDYTSNGDYDFGGKGESHNNIQPSLATNFIIKAFQSAGVMSGVAKTKTTSDNDTYSCNYINDLVFSGGSGSVKTKTLETSISFESGSTETLKSVTLNYPEGYTKDNCVPVAFSCGGLKTNLGIQGYNYAYSANANEPSLTLNNGGFNRDLILNDNNIKVNINIKGITLSEGLTVPIRIVLMKIS